MLSLLIETTKHTPFFAHYGFYLCAHPEIPSESSMPTATKLTTHIQQTLQELQRQLEVIRATYKWHADLSRHLTPGFGVESQEEHVLQQILDSHWVQGKLQYVIDWNGYIPDKHSWECTEHFRALALLRAFHHAYP